MDKRDAKRQDNDDGEMRDDPRDDARPEDEHPTEEGAEQEPQDEDEDVDEDAKETEEQRAAREERWAREEREEELRLLGPRPHPHSRPRVVNTYGDQLPFDFLAAHEEHLAERTRRLEAMEAQQEPNPGVADPQDARTFPVAILGARFNLGLRDHRVLLRRFYREFADAEHLCQLEMTEWFFTIGRDDYAIADENEPRREGFPDADDPAADRPSGVFAGEKLAEFVEVTEGERNFSERLDPQLTVRRVPPRGGLVNVVDVGFLVKLERFQTEAGLLARGHAGPNAMSMRAATAGINTIINALRTAEQVYQEGPEGQIVFLNAVFTGSRLHVENQSFWSEEGMDPY